MKKRQWTRIIIEIAVVVTLLVLVVLPITTAKLHMKIYFETGEGECIIYYATTDDPILNDEKVVTAQIENGCADLVLDAALAKNLSDVRFDFPTIKKKYRISRVELTSGGLIQKSYDASVFFNPVAVVSMNGIDAMDPVAQKVLVVTTDDPYVVFNTDRVEEIKGAFSHYTMTKLCVLLFVVAMYLCARKKLF